MIKGKGGLLAGITPGTIWAEMSTTDAEEVKRLGKLVHAGELGSASALKVVTNFLATAHLVSLCEALVTCKATGLDLTVAYEAIRISSGNSFVHQTEGQIILNGSRNIDFTMDLVLKDIGLFQALADNAGVNLELSPLMIEIFKDGMERFGERANSPSIIERLEGQCGVKAVVPGFPDAMVDDEPEAIGREIHPRHA